MIAVVTPCQHEQVPSGSERKEVENFLLVPTAIDRAARQKAADKGIRSGTSQTYRDQAHQILADFAESKRAYVEAQMLTARRRFERINSPLLDESTVAQNAIEAFSHLWAEEPTRLSAIPGKEAVAAINTRLQEQYGITVTATAIVDAMLENEVPGEMLSILEMLSTFAATSPKGTDD
jgi:hypothetical protein